jgi:phage tail sheath gpL-like
MINTGVPNSLNQARTFHTFTYLYANRALVSLPMRIALVGMKTAAGTAVVGQVYEVVDATQTDGLFGVTGELALMCRMAFNASAYLGKGPRVYAVAVAAPGVSVAAIKTFTAVGTATADGNSILKVAGRTFSVGIRNGDVQNTIATAISNALKANQENLPFTVSVAANVVSLTFPTTGVNGNDAVISVEQNVAGDVITAASPTAGTGVADYTAALDALGTLYYDGVALGNHAAADITLINTNIAAQWGATSKKWRWYFVAENGTIGTATALAAAANHQGAIVASYEGCPMLTGELATALCMGAFSRERPNATYNGMKLPLFPPAAATVYTDAEVETAISAGLTSLTAVISSDGAVIDGVSKVERMVTTKTTSGGFPFVLLRDLGVSRTGVFIARQLDVASEERFGAEANPDGTLQTDDTLDQVGDLAKSIMRASEESSILRNVEADIAKLVYERDLISLGRTNVDLWYTVVIGQHQIAWKHNVQV